MSNNYVIGEREREIGREGEREKKRESLIRGFNVHRLDINLCTYHILILSGWGLDMCGCPGNSGGPPNLVQILQEMKLAM